ncbi:MAG TPA: LysR family transcriptional regulator [Myxococcota bacterium]
MQRIDWRGSVPARPSRSSLVAKTAQPVSSPRSIDETLDIGLLRVFSTLLATRHVTRAAEKLGLTQSATSHALGRLRRAFDDELFVRGPKGMVPTDRALALAPQVQDVLARFAQLATTAVPFDPAKLVRRFVIGGGDFAEIALLPQLLPLLRRVAPGVDLTMRTTMAHIDDDLASGALDMGLGVYPTAPSTLVVKKLFDEGFVTLLRTGHPALERTLTVKRWAELDHVLITPRGSDGGIVDEVLARHGYTRRVVLQTATFSSAPLIVERTDCVTTMPARMAALLIANRNIVAVPTPAPLPRFSVMLAFHERSRGDPAHAWLREQIAQIAATSPFSG